MRITLLLLVVHMLFLHGNATGERIAPVYFAITDLFLVSATSFISAAEICEHHANAQTVGMDWGNGYDGRVLQLCLKRQRLDTLSASSATHVVQRIAVYKSSERTVCLPTETLIFRPTVDLVVCARRLRISSDVIESGNFLSDVWVSGYKHYNSDLPGWSAVGPSVLKPADSIWRALWQLLWTPSDSGAYITVQKPLMPIREVKVVTVSKDTATVDACIQSLGPMWQVAGLEHLEVEEDDRKKMAVCFRRGQTATSDRVATVLTAVTVVETKNAKCDHRDGTMTMLPLGASDRYLCLTWETAPSPESVLVDLVLADAKSEQRLGQFQQASHLNVNTVGYKHINVFTQSAWKRLELYDEAINENGLLDKPPLVARVNQANSTSKNTLSFKVLQIADLHYSGDPTTSCNDVPSGMSSWDCSEALMPQFVNELLDLEKPDFVAFTGDNVQVYSKHLRQAAIDSVTKGVEERGIPFGVIFGNHDAENGFSRMEMMQMYVQKPNAYCRRGPMDVDGVGNYELNIQAPEDGVWGKKGANVFRMYFMDSAAYPDTSKTPRHVSKYDWIKPSQITYYRQLSSVHAAAKDLVPAIMFFHIPLPEYALDTPSRRTRGAHVEPVTSSSINTNLFSSLVELDEVKATFCGHDHANDYCYQRDGVHLCYGGGIGFGTAYGMSKVQRRARVIEWSYDPEHGRTIRSWRRIFGETDRRQHEELLYADMG